MSSHIDIAKGLGLLGERVAKTPVTGLLGFDLGCTVRVLRLSKLSL